MAQLLSMRGRIAMLIGALMLAVAALGLVLLYQQLHPAPLASTDPASILLNDPLFALVLTDPSLADAGSPGGSTPDAILWAAGWFLLIPVSAVVGWRVAGRISGPVVAVTEAMDATNGDTTARVAVSSRDDELSQLGRAFNGLMNRIDDRDRERRRLLADTAHEIRNPLAVIRTNLDVALLPGGDAEALRAAADVSRRASDRIARTVDALQADSLEPQVTGAASVDLGMLVAELARDYAPVAAGRGLEIRMSARPGLNVAGDQDALRRALDNLLANGLRFAPPGTPIVVGAGAATGWRWIGVRDYGSGIDPADQPLVFSRGWRAADGAGGVGNGIGLSVVRQVAEAHGGVVRLSSVPRSGSSFTVWLPVSEADGRPRARLDTEPDPLWWLGPSLPGRHPGLADGAAAQTRPVPVRPS